MKLTRRFDQKITGERIELDPRIGYELRVTVQDPVAIYNHEDNLHPNLILQPGDEQYTLEGRTWLGSILGKTRLFVEEYQHG